MGPKTKELIDVLDRLIQMLDGDGQEHWCDWMSQARNWLLESDFYGVEKVLLAYGGMGSLNDVYLSQITRQNEVFSELRTRAWELATDIKHEQK
ncbi:DUF6966 domain-containing protein [Vibrio neptunius]|uniref:DUF6966 domain-containing protein n=1 Tax=Vibrio neptunius TaxID=170651 RepID=A0ABS3A769_9VIBR|nr:hypothetical protein [Vibrio neptunius]MBN3494743.1 hypothetical protein [Vibrio neptunius]MBN3517111.1 hypothetical protein [Vibrio neptunius]MBN3551215.1 hypothetical protein [Vibrio neptunius]MBN3579507.1 hypothetical protein [Vibrio neptunius]MCH9873172.1 hypothetical protein [Vibrio neptunius]